MTEELIDAEKFFTISMAKKKKKKEFESWNENYCAGNIEEGVVCHLEKPLNGRFSYVPPTHQECKPLEQKD